MEELKVLVKKRQKQNIPGIYSNPYEVYESRAEHDFYHVFKKFTNAVFRPQFEVGPYRLDYLIWENDKCIGVEIDGKDYHEINNDFERDKWIINNIDSNLQAIVRFKASDALYNARLCSLFLYKQFSFLFIENSCKPNINLWNDYVYKYELLEIENPENFYETYHYKTKFMPSGNVDDYELAMENRYESNIEVDPLDYCVDYKTEIYVLRAR